MRVSAKVDYAVRAAVALSALDEGSPVKGDRIATDQRIPLKFLENILGDMRRAGLVMSQRGADGGYRLAQPAERITVADIIRAVEGPLGDVRGAAPESVEYLGAAEGLKDVWLAARANLRSVLESVTVANIAGTSLPSRVRELLHDPQTWTRR